jgi:60 kDa SS-A/Ro ribonucleoprotein
MYSFLNFFKVNENQTVNSGEMLVYKLDDIERLKRFIFLGSENGSLHINKDILEYQNIMCLENLLDKCRYDDILDVINKCKNTNYRNDYLIYVLARSCSIRLDDDPLFWKKDFRSDCYKLVLEICTIPTHLFLFIQLYETINSKLYKTTGWNAHLKQMINEWYQSKSYNELMYHVTKYQKRHNWTHKDILRLSHIKAKDNTINDIFKYITKNKLNDNNPNLRYLIAYNDLKTETEVDKVVEYINEYNFVKEQIPYHLLNEAKVWIALIKNMPITALLKSLNKITALNILTDYQEILELVKRKIDTIYVHPLQLLIVLKMYNKGQGMKGGLIWEPHMEISSILNNAFYASFSKLAPTNKKLLLALDVSSSMSWNTVCGIDCLSAAEVSCAMAMMFDYVEKNVDIMGFSSEFKNLNISSKVCLEENLEHIKDNTFGNTDCSLPFVWASENKKEYDAVIVFTDNETNSNIIQPSTALQLYRTEMKTNTKLIVVALTSNGFSIANPDDSNMMDVCGFDNNMYDTINEFLEM